MLRPSYSIFFFFLSAPTSTSIVCCLGPSKVAHDIFSHCPEKLRGSFKQIPRLKQVNLYELADTRLSVHNAGGVRGKTLSIYLSGFWQRTELTSTGVPSAARGGFVHRTYMPSLCPETHVICKSYSLKTGRDVPRYGLVSCLHNS